jgi:ORF6N domain-containing protein
MTKADLVPTEFVERRILTIRGHNVIIDADLAELYGVETRALNQAIRRNIERFPEDFAFRLTADEFDNLRSQSVISNTGRGGRHGHEKPMSKASRKQSGGLPMTTPEERTRENIDARLASWATKFPKGRL